MINKIFKKINNNKTKIEMFGRMIKTGEQPKCDVCDKEVNMSDYIYLCRTCRDKLPKSIQNTHHILVPYEEARKKYLKEVIKGVSI